MSETGEEPSNPDWWQGMEGVGFNPIIDESGNVVGAEVQVLGSKITLEDEDFTPEMVGHVITAVTGGESLGSGK